MLKRTLAFTKPYHLSLKNRQMIIRTKDDSGTDASVPVEDIGFVILENQEISITMPLLNALADNNTAVIICSDKFMPNAMFMNLDSNSTQGESFRAQLSASGPMKKNIWKQIVEAKIRNQAALLRKLGKDGDSLKPYYQNVKSGDSDNREGVAAKLYWDMLFDGEFMRVRSGPSPNEMLNYGYTVLRAAVARSLTGSGLLPSIGIFHKNRYNAFPLADDVMEPYRPYVDEIVFYLYANGENSLNKYSKSAILKLLYTDTVFGNVTRPLDIGLSITTASLAKCYNGVQKKILYPLLK